MASNVAIAIEAKHREPTCASCKKWLADSSEGSNRTTVLDGWLDQINTVAGAQLTRADVMDLPYQLVHRTASLFSVPADLWYLVYQLFEEGQGKASVPDLVAFRELLKGPTGFHVAVMNCQFRPSHEFEPIVRRWDEGERSEGLAKQVHDAILRGPIFEFDTPSLRLDGELVGTT